jgi:uncharacterized phiE125 gp8 family phage protein
MMLIEETQVPSAALPLAEFKAHLRLGTGFAEAGATDAYLEEILRAALAAAEGRTGKALYARNFRWSVSCWRESDRQALPIAPVSAILSLAVADRAGAETAIDPARYWLEKDSLRPYLVSSGTALPTIPVGGTAEVRFTAGFGAAWLSIPVELRQAVLLIAAGYFERRHEEGAEPGAMPFGVMALLERWRNVRAFAGGRR